VSIKRRALERHLRQHGAAFKCHGGKHDVWRGPNGKPSTVPRHRSRLVTVLVAGAIVGVLASLRPARRAARLDVVQAITAE
jgi:hypothetical protein